MQLFELKFGEVMNFLGRESLAYKLIFLYLIFEYVRPQTLYPVLDVLPYGKIILVACLIFHLGENNPLSVSNPINKLLWLYFAIIIMSSVLGISFENSSTYWIDFLTWILIYYLIVNIVNTKERFFLFMFFFLLYSFKMAQFSFRGWVSGGMGYSTYGFGGGPGWFHNSGEFGIQMCVYFPMAFYFYFALREYWPRWKKIALAALPFTGITGMLSSSNRGTIVGGAAVFLWIAVKGKLGRKYFLLLVVVTLLAYQFIPEEQLDRFRQAGEDATSVTRLDNWKKGVAMTNMFPFFGVGFKNWQIADFNYFSGSGLLSHNVFVECMSELGYVGLLVFILLIIATLRVNYQTRQILRGWPSPDAFFFISMAHALDAALIGFLASGFFVTVLYYPYFWINLSFTVALHNVATKTQLALNESQ